MELLWIKTDSIEVTIKGHSSNAAFVNEQDLSEIRISCDAPFRFSVKESTPQDSLGLVETYQTAPLFFEQHLYEIMVVSTDSSVDRIEFWHENLNIREKVTAGRRADILWGAVNFKNNIGLSDLLFLVDGDPHLKIQIEVFPTKIDYKSDYQAIIEDITSEMHSLVFDFLRETYFRYKGDRHINKNSQVEFFGILDAIFEEVLRAADAILTAPYHELKKEYRTVPMHKARRIDAKCRRWIEKHPTRMLGQGQNNSDEHTLTCSKNITYDTQENRYFKYILTDIVQRVKSFRSSYLEQAKKTDDFVVQKTDRMIDALNRRLRAPVFANVEKSVPKGPLSLAFTMGRGYRELHKYYIMLSQGLSVLGETFHMSVKDLAVLYEYWCFIKLNGLLRNKYKLVAQDVLSVEQGGLSVRLKKGSESEVKYEDPKTQETILLRYNKSHISLPTVAQKPDNVLELKKAGDEGTQWKYIFDAKYRIDPGKTGPSDDEHSEATPGPHHEDINAMHRYRDAIVDRGDDGAFRRGMVGAYVLFPYTNEEEYKQHRFYKSIESVNVGGLPFLPSAVGLVTDMLDELIQESGRSAAERVLLPQKVEESLRQVDWKIRDVYIASVSSPEELEKIRRTGFLLVSPSKADAIDSPIRYVALYQTKAGFGSDAGIKYYAPVKQIESLNDESLSRQAYGMRVSEWKQLQKSIAVSGRLPTDRRTNLFLLTHSKEVPQLGLRSEEEYRMYVELTRAYSSIEINDDAQHTGFSLNGTRIDFENGRIVVKRGGESLEHFSLSEFGKTPGKVFRNIRQAIEKHQENSL